ncbi:radical SAM protein [Sulfurivermis fontis]|uniref:radical SAM protein n=1 Tax=Sulfurivermis fontis TaxID=1972068 RepID=UPI0018D51D3A|nr:radical SAM protein [Sulfurivermis fontis]
MKKLPIDYDHPLYRPPGESDNLIIQATLGCSYNQCSFCAMYRGKHYQARPLEQVYADIDAAAQDWPDARRLFLADGDALALPTPHLLQLLDYLALRLPRMTRVSCYATPANIRRKSTAELAQLRAHKLSLLYVGIESGSALILKKITKGATPHGITAALHQAHAAGMRISATVILGLGGREYSTEHITGTLALLNSAPLTQLSTLQLYLDDGMQSEFAHKFGTPFALPDDHALLYEQRRLVAGLMPPQAIVFRSDHASNALALQGVLPRDRTRLLAAIDAARAGRRPLRPPHQRGL